MNNQTNDQINNNRGAFEQQSKAILDADLQQRQTLLDANIDRARRLRAAEAAKPKRSWRPAYGLAAAGLAVAIALPMYLSPPTTAPGTGQLAINDAEMLNDLDLAFWLADLDSSQLPGGAP